MEPQHSLPGTVEGLLQGSNSFECTPPLAELTPDGTQAILEFQGSWTGILSQEAQEDGGEPVIRVTDYMTFDDAEAPEGPLEGNLLQVDSLERLLNLENLEYVEQPIKQEGFAESRYMGPPATNVYEGDYGFDVRCPNRVKSTKSVTWTYAEHYRKLYANRNTACPFHIHVEKAPPPGTVVRVMAVYAEPEDRMEVIQRCVLHADPKNNQGDGVAPPDHFVHCDSPKAEYHEDPDSGRHSLTVLYEEPQAGLNFMQCLLRFMCLSSCASSMRRRAVKLIWTLENSGRVLGRQAVGLKVCACPGRDRMTEERAATKQRGSAILDPAPLFETAVLPAVATTSRGHRKRALVDAPVAFTGGPSKSRRVEPEEERTYQFVCSNREIFDTLKLMRDSLMALKQHRPALFRAHLRRLASHEGTTTVKQEPGETASSGESQE